MSEPMPDVEPCRITAGAFCLVHWSRADARATTCDHAKALAEVDRLRAGIEALTENYRNHYEMHGAAGDDYVVEDGRCVDVDDLLALLNPTEGETDE